MWILDKALVELLDTVRVMALSSSKRLRLPSVKSDEINKEFKRIVKTIRCGRHVARTGYHYLHAVSYTKDGKTTIEIQPRLGGHGTKVIITPEKWKDFTTWVDGYWVTKPDTLQQWRNMYGKTNGSDSYPQSVQRPDQSGIDHRGVH